MVCQLDVIAHCIPDQSVGFRFASLKEDGSGVLYRLNECWIGLEIHEQVFVSFFARRICIPPMDPVPWVKTTEGGHDVPHGVKPSIVKALLCFGLARDLSHVEVVHVRAPY